ncbi:hypothetical protein Pan97_41540 [Bremerella volcania]|uniref:HEAT repeat protein n=1 Tax=Bremerella volcania TaxID=2527984 RepID=A0A518CCY7_9BACT|nr:hypothetical protein [Bremerella volcania]QDU77093.1 hypothetical protein Pan97_41540 [Bremerella volcania]
MIFKSRALSTFFVLTLLVMTGCSMSSRFPSDPGKAGDDGTGMLKSFLTQIADPNSPMPEMFGAEPAFESALRSSPDKIAPLKPLYIKLKSASGDTQRRKVAEEMLQKLSESSTG